MKRSIFILAAMVLLSSSVWADAVLLNNGDRLSGTVDSISGGRVLLDTEYAGNVAIKLDAVAELVTDGSFDVHTATGKRNGRFALVQSAQVLVTEAGPEPIDLPAIEAAGQNKLGLLGFTPSWTSRADFAATISSGNTDTEKYNTLVESLLKRESVQYSLSLLIASEEAEQETTKDEIDLEFLYKRFVSEKWYASGNAEYFKDELKDVDSRITLGAGMGYQFWDDSFGSFSTDVGLSYVREDIAGETENNPALRWGLEYRRFLFSKRLEAFHTQSVLFIPDSDRGEVLESSTGLRYAMNSRVDAFTRADVIHETEPAPGSSKTDVTYNIGIGVKF